MRKNGYFIALRREKSMKYTKPERVALALSGALALALAFPQTVSAMHIMEGYLPIVHCVVWGAVCLPFLAAGVISIRRTSGCAMIGTRGPPRTPMSVP